MKGQGRDPNIFHARYFDILKMARDRELVTMRHLWEMAFVVSNGHVIDDVM